MRRHEERIEHDCFQAEFAAAIVAHTVAIYAGKSLKPGTALAYGDFMPSQRKNREAAARKAMQQSLRDYLHGLAKDRGLA